MPKKPPKVVTKANLLQMIEEVRADYRVCVEREESWDLFWKQCETTLYETTLKACEEARKRSSSDVTVPAAPDPFAKTT